MKLNDETKARIRQNGGPAKIMFARTVTYIELDTIDVDLHRPTEEIVAEIQALPGWCDTGLKPDGTRIPCDPESDAPNPALDGIRDQIESCKAALNSPK